MKIFGPKLNSLGDGIKNIRKALSGSAIGKSSPTIVNSNVVSKDLGNDVVVLSHMDKNGNRSKTKTIVFDKIKRPMLGSITLSMKGAWQRKTYDLMNLRMRNKEKYVQLDGSTEKIEMNRKTGLLENAEWLKKLKKVFEKS